MTNQPGGLYGRATSRPRTFQAPKRRSYSRIARKSTSSSGSGDRRAAGIQANLKKKPFDDPRVTRALRLLINHDEANTGWAEVYFGRGYLSAYLPAALDSWDLSEQDYRGYLEFKTPERRCHQ